MAMLEDIAGHQIMELGPTTTVGRDPACGVSIPDPLASRAHAEIRRMPDGRYKIVDLGSTHGTYVSNKKVAERVLSDGDEIIVGTTRLRFQDHDAGASSEERGGIEAEAARHWALESYPRLESVWGSSPDFLELFEPGEGPGRFFHPVPEDRDLPPECRPGALLSVMIRFLDRDAPDFHVHARVLERLTSGKKRGLRLEFIAEERDRRDLVLACAQGDSIPHFRRRHERVACRLPVRVSEGEGKKLVSTATDISEGGLGLVLDQALTPETVVNISISFPGRRKPLSVRGRVASVVSGGPQKGAGMEFLFESSEQRNEIADRVALLRSKR